MASFLDSMYSLWNQIVSAVLNMRPVFDLLDILVIAFIIYKAIGFFRDSRAGQLFKGLLILLIVYLISFWWDLVSIRWILSKFMSWAIIAIAIIFQPELRHALERMGRSKFGFYNQITADNSSYKESIDKICQAADNMHSKKIGALIVFERTTALGDIIDTGTVIDAKISPQIIENVFFPKSPLHDGAMIIRDGSVYAGGCILPLSSNQDINIQYGTRHRAALGITENTDAVVLIVSEETGNISIAVNGKIKSGYDFVTLREYLYELLIPADDSQKKEKLLKRLSSKVLGIFKKEDKNNGK